MSFWAVLVPADRYQHERLYHHQTVEVDGVPGPVPGDYALLVADTEPAEVFGWARVVRNGAGGLAMAYRQRNIDSPAPADDLKLDGAATVLDEGGFWAAVGRLAPPAARKEWMVSVDLPIEADSPAEAVREFWTYLRTLGPTELPAFVSPRGDDLAMQAYLLGEPVNLDPEED